MKTYRHLYDEIISDANIELAIKESCKKRKKSRRKKRQLQDLREDPDRVIKVRHWTETYRRRKCRPKEIYDGMLMYNKGSGQVLAGLTRRRQAERELFLNGASEAPATGNPYGEPTKTIKLNSKGNDVRWMQYQLNSKGGYKLIVDGVAGNLTIGALMDFQKKNGLTPDGMCGPLTRAALQ